jgi:hypothetical protein
MTVKGIGFAALSACVALTIGCGNKTQQATTTNTEGATSQAPSGQQAANQKAALVRFVNAVPGRAVDLWFGDQKAFTDVSYKTVTPYKELPNERHDFKLTRTGQANPDATNVKNSEGLNAGDHYTIVATLDNNGKEKLDVITDRLSEPANGKAKIRVINASGEEVDVYAPAAMNSRTSGSADRAKNPNAARNEEEKWFGGVNQVSSTSYKEVDPMNGTLQIRPANANNKRVARGGVNVPVDLNAGKLYTLVVTGGERGHALDVIRVEDQLTGPVASNTNAPASGPVR